MSRNKLGGNPAPTGPRDGGLSDPPSDPGYMFPGPAHPRKHRQTDGP